jgi:putative membrane protein
MALGIVFGLVAATYAWRFQSGRRNLPGFLSPWRLAAFLAGALALWVAAASPLAHWDQGHLTGHMIQHLLIMTVAAPLLLLGEPLYVLGRRRQPSASGGWRSPHPLLCWFAGTFTVIVWHVPALFELGMSWHGFQHATFFLAGLLFWVPVIRPWPTVARWPLWSIPLYLFLATLPCDGLSAFLAFCGRVIYPHYAAHAHCDGPALSALDDQQRAGALMWFWVTIAYLLPAALVTIDLLSPQKRAIPHGLARSAR